MKTLNNDEELYYGDMKPANILILRNKEIKIGDFGISILFSSDPE